MIYLENLFLLGFIAFNLIYDSFLPYYLLFVNLTSPSKEDDDSKELHTQEELSADNSVKSWSLPSLFNCEAVVAQEELESTVEVKQTYEVSELTDENVEFMASILSELELEPVTDLAVSTQQPKDENVEVIKNDSVEEEYEILSMEAWHEKVTQFEPDPTIISNVTARIGDKLMGIQTWVCTVVGYEENYIHVLDGLDRAWVHLSSLDVPFAINDTIELVVNRTENKIEVQHISILNSDSPTSFEEDVEEVDEYGYEEVEIYAKTAEV